MNSQNVDSVTVVEKTEFESSTARAVDGVGSNSAAEEIGLDDLLGYQPVPPRRVARIVVRYQRVGRGRPLPYLIDEVSPE
jgi:hypothetical protein